MGFNGPGGTAGLVIEVTMRPVSFQTIFFYFEVMTWDNHVGPLACCQLANVPEGFYCCFLSHGMRFLRTSIPFPGILYVIAVVDEAVPSVGS